MGSRILIVDDDEQLAKVVSTYLRMAGHEVKSVNDGSAAMDAIASFGRQYFAERGLEIECLAAAERHSISV